MHGDVVNFAAGKVPSLVAGLRAITEGKSFSLAGTPYDSEQDAIELEWLSMFSAGEGSQLQLVPGVKPSTLDFVVDVQQTVDQANAAPPDAAAVPNEPRPGRSKRQQIAVR